MSKGNFLVNFLINANIVQLIDCFVVEDLKLGVSRNLILIPWIVLTISFTIVVVGSNAPNISFFSPKMELIVALYPTLVLPRTRIFNEKSKSSLPSASSCIANLFVADSRLNFLLEYLFVSRTNLYKTFETLKSSVEMPSLKNFTLRSCIFLIFLFSFALRLYSNSSPAVGLGRFSLGVECNKESKPVEGSFELALGWQF